MHQPDSPDRDMYSSAVLSMSGTLYFSIDPPDEDHLFAKSSGGITVDGLSEDPDHFPLFEFLKPKLPCGAFCCRLFVHDWNSFIHVVATEAAFVEES